jgi:hypothetical protein
MSRTLCIINWGRVTTLIIVALLLVFAAGSVADNFQGYKPVYSLGSEKDDWWIKYPNQSPKAGSLVNHLPWVVDALKDKPVIILDHSKDCKACKVQMKDLNNVLNIYGNDITYYNITAMADGSGDQRAFDVLDIYYPNGGIPTVPTTVVFTLLRDANGKAEIGWHTMDDAMGEETITSYVKDAIFYYRQNSAYGN